jgi:hypothetical protein
MGRKKIMKNQKNEFKKINLKESTYYNIEEIRRELGLRHLTKAVEWLIEKYKGGKL